LIGRGRLKARPAIPNSQPRNGASPIAGQHGPAAAPILRGPQRERHEPDWLLLFSVVALATLGILMVYSSTGVYFLLKDDPFAIVGPQAVWGVLGAVLMIAIMRTDYRYLRAISVPAFVIALILLAVVMLPPIGPLRPIVAGGSARWLQIGPLPSMHPAEFAKLALVVYLAHWLARRGGKAASLTQGLLPFMLILGIVVMLVVVEPDLGTTGVIALTGLTMFFVAGGRLTHLAVLVPAGVAAVAIAVTQYDYQMQRIQTFLNPWADRLGDGHQTVQGLLALGMGGATGIGLGQSRQPGAIALPQSQNDFVFALVGQELGFIGALLVIGLYVLLAYRGLRVALGAPDTFGALLATGITAWLVIQAFINIAVVVVLLPITGITLPFVSAGGSSLLVSFAAVGILLSISRETLPRGTWNDADSHRGRWHRRPRLPGAGRRSVPARAGA
jgi:cell division protein FtsW